jgi:hypothetical protein
MDVFSEYPQLFSSENGTLAYRVPISFRVDNVTKLLYPLTYDVCQDTVLLSDGIETYKIDRKNLLSEFSFVFFNFSLIPGAIYTLASTDERVRFLTYISNHDNQKFRFVTENEELIEFTYYGLIDERFELVNNVTAISLLKYILLDTRFYDSSREIDYECRCPVCGQFHNNSDTVFCSIGCQNIFETMSSTYLTSLTHPTPTSSTSQTREDIISSLEYFIEKKEIICDECGKQCTTLYTLYNGKSVCRHCLKNLYKNYYLCSDCNKYYPREFLTPIFDNDNQLMCHECMQKYKVLHCEWCGSYFIDRCRCNIPIYDYNERPDMIFFTEPENRKTIGVEWEIDTHQYYESLFRICHRVLSITKGHSFFKRDGSLSRGIEVVSYPHSEQEFLKLPFKDLFKIIKEEKFTRLDTCGLHFHFSREWFTDNTTIAKIIAFTEKHKNYIYKISKRTSKSRFKRYSDFYNIVLTSEDFVNEFIQTPLPRYHAINLTNKDTVEFRFFAAAKSSKRLFDCFKFLVFLIKRMDEITWDDLDSLDKVLETLPNNLSSFRRGESNDTYECSTNVEDVVGDAVEHVAWRTSDTCECSINLEDVAGHIDLPF